MTNPPREEQGYKDDPHPPQDDETNAIGPDGPSQLTTERIAGRALIYSPSPTEPPPPRSSSYVAVQEPQQSSPSGSWDLGETIWGKEGDDEK